MEGSQLYGNHLKLDHERRLERKKLPKYAEILWNLENFMNKINDQIKLTDKFYRLILTSASTITLMLKFDSFNGENKYNERNILNISC